MASWFVCAFVFGSSGPDFCSIFHLPATGGPSIIGIPVKKYMTPNAVAIDFLPTISPVRTAIRTTKQPSWKPNTMQ